MKEPISRPQWKTAQAAVPRPVLLFPWTKEEDQLVGKFTDREVAERLNRTRRAVTDRRRFLGRPGTEHPPQPLRMEREPRDGYARLFAAKSDQELRALLGWSYTRIHTRRRQLAAGKVRRAAPEWTVEEDRLLGTMPDRELARRLGRTVTAVTHRRSVKHVQIMKPWRPGDLKVLGTRSDEEIALLLGGPISTVRTKRWSLGTPPKAKFRPWTAAEEAALGTRPDEELARALGRRVKTVARRRQELGKSKPGGGVKWIKVAAQGVGTAGAVNTAKGKRGWCTWKPEQDALLGRFTDAEVARKLGIKLPRVRRRRMLLGVPNNNPALRWWTPEELALLGTRPDSEVAPLVKRTLKNLREKRLREGIPPCNPHWHPWKPDELALLGQLSDEEVARRTGHPIGSVSRKRVGRGVPNPRRHKTGWRPEDEALLGTAPDREIAARLNRTFRAVINRRYALGIPRWRRPRARPA